MLTRNTTALFGPPPTGRGVRIMLTAPSKAADDGAVVRDLLRAGMDTLRINCAKDGPEHWAQIIGHLRQAQRETGRPCRVLMDLAGPNPRTAPLRDHSTNKKGKKYKKKHAHEIKLRTGDRFILQRDPDAEHPDEATPRIGCTLEQVLRDAVVGQHVLYDDGALEAVVRAAGPDTLELEVVRARKRSVRVRMGKGLNFPETDLSLPGLTDTDLERLGFVCQHADLVGLSFVRRPGDVLRVFDELDRREAHRLGVILKLETRGAIQVLPDLLLTAMRRRPIGVMVTRGDMGAELGLVRMSEVQEEVLWFCEAAHLPVVWATQVLESLAKTGLPSRGEVTDAARSSRAECVMLNKGDYILDTVGFLRDVIQRMRTHHIKKFPTMRQLSISAPPDRLQ